MTSARNVCTALGGHWYGAYGTACCPCHEDREPSLSVRDGRNGKLLVKCHAGCEGADVLAALSAHGLLARRADRHPGLRTRGDSKTKLEAEQCEKTKWARQCWTEANPISGTLAERYLRQRSITCELPQSLRFHPNCWHGPRQSKVPAMVGAVLCGNDFVGVHRTYLAEPGVKAFESKAKLMLGRCAGGAIQLSDGRGPLVVAEGIETALSLLSGLQGGGPRVWAALSSSGMGKLTLPDEAGELVIAPDGDKAGRGAATVLAERALSAGWRVRLMRCPDGADWNDVVRRMAA